MAGMAGAEKLVRKLGKLPDAARQQINQAIAEQADEIVAMMKRLVSVQSGDLRDSIGWAWGNEAPKGSIAVATVSTDRSDLTVTIYAGNAKAYYARWVEFGTRKMRARPFFFVTWRANRKNAKNRIRAAARKAAKQVWASG